MYRKLISALMLLLIVSFSGEALAWCVSGNEGYVPHVLSSGQGHSLHHTTESYGGRYDPSTQHDCDIYARDCSDIGTCVEMPSPAFEVTLTKAGNPEITGGFFVTAFSEEKLEPLTAIDFPNSVSPSLIMTTLFEMGTLLLN